MNEREQPTQPERKLVGYRAWCDVLCGWKSKVRGDPESAKFDFENHMRRVRFKSLHSLTRITKVYDDGSKEIFR